MTPSTIRRIVTALLAVALCAGVSSARQTSPQQQNTAEPPQTPAQQRLKDEEKNLITAVTAAESGDPDPKVLLMALQRLAGFYQSHNMRPQLSPVLDRELALAEKVFPNDATEFVRLLHQIGMGYGLCNEHDRAEQVLRRALDLDTKTYGMNSQQVASDFVDLGHTTMFRRDSPDSENYFMQALAIEELRNDDSAIAQTMGALAMLASIQRDPQKADAILGREIEALKLHPEKNALQIVMALDSRARVAAGRKDLTAAIDDTQQAIAIAQTAPSRIDLFWRNDLYMLANYYMQRGDVGPAEESFQQAIQMDEADDKNTKHMTEDLPLMGLARLYQQEKKFKESEAILTRVMTLDTDSRGPDSPVLAHVHMQFAELYADEQKFADAEAQYRKAISIAETDTGPVNHELPEYLAEFSYFLRKQNRIEEADKFMQRARELDQKRRAAVQNQTPQF